MRKHVAPFGGDAPIGYIEADLFATEGTYRARRCYRLSHDLTVKNKTASPANKATEIAATEY